MNGNTPMPHNSTPMPEISQEKLLREEVAFLQNQLTEWAMLYQQIDLGVLKGYLDSGYPITYVNNAFLSLTGYTRAEIFEQVNHIAIVYPGDVERFGSELRRQLKTGNSFVLEYRLIKKSGELLWVLAKGEVAAKSGHKDILQCLITDISLQKHKEEELLISEKRHEILLGLTGITTFEYSPNTGLIRINVQDNREFGMPLTMQHGAEDVIASGAILPRSHQALRDFYRRIDEGESSSYAIVGSVGRDGREHSMELRLVTVFDAQGRALRAIGTRTDITEKLDLIYRSQHDMLTDCYDKATFEELVSTYLGSPEGASGCHAFFIFDLDHFKAINDTFGHAFGDIVLTQTSSRLQALFSPEDLLGRIGGDEFAILMKNLPNYETAQQKAQEMCSSVLDTYSQNGIHYKISASTGLAYFSKDGQQYQELYTRSDAALYYAKEHGRNGWAAYRSDMEAGITSVHKIDDTQLFPAKKFEDNISEYIFRTLYESSSKEDAIHAVLKLIGSYYHTSRAYVLEYSPDQQFLVNTFEWCNVDIRSQKERLARLTYQELGDYQSNFNDAGIFSLPNAATAKPVLRAILEAQRVKSLLQFSIVKDNRIIGFIGFDQCDYCRTPSNRELADCRNVANILGVFILEMRALAESQAARKTSLSIINSLNSYAYVCDPESYEVLLINDKGHQLVPNAKVGDCCYRSFWGQEAPCHMCPMRALRSSDKPRHVTELHNAKLGIWVRTTATRIDWMDHRQACLVDSVDITEYKNRHEKK